ncbi:hypothetical protein SAMN05421539_11812 [Jannaschia seohaensis]|uniref:Uncharacterized protein n=1 Tax=Jannaschia seohaensis TaxID=475081 RepID=A0A2Y9B4C4_9RHOB|nr:hypothetical protein BCF38_11812 [Jannaschia seohaensis]SSA51261.1 hypothetical protein SAMN05421539_11812 [Jannaschia seohaensis]
MGNPAAAGARIAVLDDRLASLPIAEADLGIPWNWRIGPVSCPVSDETYVAQAFTPAGVGLRPFSVAHVEQPWRKPRTPGDLTIRWTRRSRALAADSWGDLGGAVTVRGRQDDLGPPGQLARGVAVGDHGFEPRSVDGAPIQADVIAPHTATLTQPAKTGNLPSGGGH